MRYKALYQLRWITIPPIRFEGFYDDNLLYYFFITFNIQRLSVCENRRYFGDN